MQTPLTEYPGVGTRDADRGIASVKKETDGNGCHKKDCIKEISLQSRYEPTRGRFTTQIFYRSFLWSLKPVCYELDDGRRGHPLMNNQSVSVLAFDVSQRNSVRFEAYLARTG